MPAERTKSSSRRSNEGQATQLVWAVDPPTPAGRSTSVAFAANVTPTSFEISSSASISSAIVQFDALPPLVDAPPPPPPVVVTEFQLFSPPTDSPSTTKRVPHSKKKPENHIPRPPNAFILFRSSFIKSQHVSAEVETNHSTLSKIIGMTWQNLPEDERQAWHAKAKIALDEHRRKFPKYTFRPTQSKTRCKASSGSSGGSENAGGNGGSGKRRVREVEPKDLKRCAKIAELLVEGKKGQELDMAIQEFDRHHVPEIVTRFEAPITARAFRRSSSAPIPDTENSRKSQTFLPSSPMLAAMDRNGKIFPMVRAASSRPIRCSTPQHQHHQQDGRVFKDGGLGDLITRNLKQEPSLDFSSFSFSNINQPLHAFECDPLSPLNPNPASPTAISQMSDGDAIYSAPAPLSIQNLPPFLMDDWALPSPLSSFHPSDAYVGESPSPITPFASCAFQNFGGKPFVVSNDHHPLGIPDHLSLPMPHLEYNPSGEFSGGLDMLNMQMESMVPGLGGGDAVDYISLFNQHCVQQQQQRQPGQHEGQHLDTISHLDLDLTALMAATMPPQTEFVL
ncbi:hypothetical protein AX17_007464 [Amanita inopinata Kibby_2008]|nr:hypothetical protein AX17_007464 [Amanita inopinata Kibby_2008]